MKELREIRNKETDVILQGKSLKAGTVTAHIFGLTFEEAWEDVVHPIVRKALYNELDYGVEDALVTLLSYGFDILSEDSPQLYPTDVRIYVDFDTCEVVVDARSFAVTLNFDEIYDLECVDNFAHTEGEER